MNPKGPKKTQRTIYQQTNRRDRVNDNMAANGIQLAVCCKTLGACLLIQYSYAILIEPTASLHKHQVLCWNGQTKPTPAESLRKGNISKLYEMLSEWLQDLYALIK